MKRFYLIGVIPLLLWGLCGCGSGVTRAQSIQEQYSRLATAEMEAEVVCHLGDESRTYALSCTLDGDTATTAVLAPEELQGVTATVSPDGLSVTYDGTSLPAGELEDVAPANCLPYLLHALGSGYLLEESRETLGDVACYRLALDTTAQSGDKVVCTVWIDADTLVPRYAECSRDGQTFLTVQMLAFSCTVSQPTEE